MQELAVLGTISEVEGAVRCLGFGSTVDLWPFLVLEDAGLPLSHHIQLGSQIAARPLAKQLLRVLGMQYCPARPSLKNGNA